MAQTVRGPVDPKLYRKLWAFLYVGKPYLTYRCHLFFGVCPFFSLWVGKGTDQGEQCSKLRGKAPSLGATRAGFRLQQNSAPASLSSCVSIQMRHLLNCPKQHALGGGRGMGRLPMHLPQEKGCGCPAWVQTTLQEKPLPLMGSFGGDRQSLPRVEGQTRREHFKIGKGTQAICWVVGTSLRGFNAWCKTVSISGFLQIKYKINKSELTSSSLNEPPEARL